MTIDATLVRRLLAAQFPRWAHLPVEPVEQDGWDNRTFRLGEEMSVRLPSAEIYSGQVEKENLWLPRLGPLLPLPIPAPLAMGTPSSEYPWRWSVYRWLKGRNASVEPARDLPVLAAELAEFLTVLQHIDPSGGPPPGRHNFFRGGPLSNYHAETLAAIATLREKIDGDAVTAVWDAALGATWPGPAVWFHGDVGAANLLVTGGRLSAVIDFGNSGVGDPACDLAIAWTLFSGKSREAFRATLSPDGGTWARGRGWALWKALVTLTQHAGTDPLKAEQARRTMDEVLADHRNGD